MFRRTTYEGEDDLNEFKDKNSSKVNSLCPNQNEYLDRPISPPKIITNLFLYYNCKNIREGCRCSELNLNGTRVLRKLGRRIYDTDLPIILSYMITDDDIVSLDLSNNNLTDTGFGILCKYLISSKLVYLNIRNNDLKNLSDIGLEIINSIKTLKRLTLSGNQLYRETADNLKRFLETNDTLEVLELEAVDYYVHCINRITDALIDNKNTALKVLNISRLLGIPRYRLRSYYLAEIIKTLLMRNNTLVELHLEKNGISDHDIESIVKGLKDNSTLVVINLTANNISNIGVEKIAAILPGSSLQVLLLRSNTIGNHGAIALSKTMPLSKILHLDIAHNRIDHIGLSNLLWTIKKPTPLYTFFIFGNHITKQTLEIIHMQMIRGKIIPDSLDIILYWEENGDVRCSYNPDADIYRNQMHGAYDCRFIAKKDTTLPYPTIDVLRPYISLKRRVDYPKETNPRMMVGFKDHIAVK